MVDNPGSDPFESTRIAAGVNGLMKADPEAALPRVAARNDDRLLTNAGRALADVWFEEGVLAGELGSFSVCWRTRPETLFLAMPSAYGAAADWPVNNASDGMNRPTLTVLATQWVEQDLEGAVSWVHALPEGSLRRQGLEVAIDTWLAGGDMASAANWLNEQPPHEDLDGAGRKVALNTYYEDPEAAMTWAVSIVDEDLRIATMYFITSHWMSSTPDGARVFLEANELEALAETISVGDSGVQIFQGGGDDSTGCVGYSDQSRQAGQ